MSTEPHDSDGDGTPPGDAEDRPRGPERPAEPWGPPPEGVPADPPPPGDSGTGRSAPGSPAGPPAPPPAQPPGAPPPPAPPAAHPGEWAGPPRPAIAVVLAILLLVAGVPGVVCGGCLIFGLVATAAGVDAGEGTGFAPLDEIQRDAEEQQRAHVEGFGLTMQGAYIIQAVVSALWTLVWLGMLVAAWQLLAPTRFALVLVRGAGVVLAAMGLLAAVAQVFVNPSWYLSAPLCDMPPALLGAAVAAVTWSEPVRAWLMRAEPTR